MRRTKRKPGPADEHEVKQYQTARGLLVDGIPGNETIGQFKLDIQHWKDMAEKARQELAELKAKQGWDWGATVLGGVAGMILMAAVQVI